MAVNEGSVEYITLCTSLILRNGPLSHSIDHCKYKG